MTTSNMSSFSESQKRGEPLHNLPLPTFEEFVGRQEELMQLYKLLSPQSDWSVISVRGIGGTGKSALALQIGRSYLQRAELQPPGPGFDAVVWVSVGTSQVAPFGQAPVIREFRTLRDLLTAIALTFGRTDVMEMSVIEQQRVVWELLTANRTLLIVDNLEESVDLQVLEFISNPPASTKVLVTARQRIVSGRDLVLAGLSDADASEFARAECAKRGLRLSTAQIQRLVRAASFIPMAIQFALGQIYDGLPYERVISLLGETGTEISEDFLARTADRLEGTDAYTILLAASIFSQDTSPEVLGVAAGIDDPDARDNALTRLIDLSFLQERADRFSMLPLVRRWLQSILRTHPDIENDFWRRLTDYYKAYVSSPRSEPELQAEAEAVIDVAVWHMNRDNWETASQLLEPFSSIPSANRYLKFAEQMDLVEQNPDQMYVSFATLEEMPRVCELESGEFVNGVASSSEKMIAIFARNPKTFMVLKTRTGEICGFASVWPVVPKLVDDLISRKRNYTQILPEEARPADYAESHPTDYYVDTIMVTDPETNKYGAFLLLRWIQKMLISPIRIVSVSVTPFGNALVESLNMRIVWTSEEPIGVDYHNCCLVDTRDPSQKSVADRLVLASHRWRGE